MLMRLRIKAINNLSSVINKVKATAFVGLIGMIAPITASAVTRAATVRITKTRYQHIDGFGGCGMNGQWADKYTETKVKALWGTGEESIGLNIMRVRINPNEGNWGEYGNAIKWARKYNPGVTVFATPWTPPKKWKTSKSTKYKNEFGTDVWPLVEHTWGGQGSNGGTFNDVYTEEYADFFERYRQTMEQKGCPIDMISIQNESDYTPTATDNGVEHASYESCVFSPNQMAKILKATREHVDPKCKVMGPECFGWAQHNYNNKLATLPDAVNSIDIWGNHMYGLQDYSHVSAITKKTGKHMWMTEFLMDNKTSIQGTKAGTWENEFGTIDNIELVMKGGFSAYVYYNMLADFFGNGLSDNGENSSVLFKRAYVFGHYAWYATGKDRINSTISDGNASDKLTGSAYASADGDTITVFLLNRSTANYTVNLVLPDTMWTVRQIVTNESVNRKVIDKSAEYGGVTRPRLSLLPKTFYTFEFIRKPDTAVKDFASYKTPTNSNPINPLTLCAEPTSIDYNGRMFVYATNDQQQFDLSDGLLVNDNNKITQLVVMSTIDLVNWTHHGIIDVKAIAPWITSSRAPSVTWRHNDVTDKDEFFLYFSNATGGIGVLTAESPLGPWTDTLGHALIDKSTPGLGTITSIIDPGAVIDPDGNGWLAFGGGKPNKEGTAAKPGNARLVRLGSDMISLGSDIVTLDASYHLEANDLNVMGSKLVFTYCQNSNATEPGSMCYMAVNLSEALTGKWTNKGVFFKNPGKSGYPTGSNHTRIQKLGNYWYLLYQTQWLEQKMGYSGGYHNLGINRVTILEASPKMGNTTPTDAGVSQITSERPDIYNLNTANTFANAAGVSIVADTIDATQTYVAPQSGGWTMVRMVTCGTGDADEVTVSASGSATVEVFIDAMTDDKLIASGTIDGTATLPLQSEINGTHNLYFRFSNTNDFQFRAWQFVSTTGIEELTPTRANQSTAIFNLNGQRLQHMQPGVNIVGGKKILVK